MLGWSEVHCARLLGLITNAERCIATWRVGSSMMAKQEMGSSQVYAEVGSLRLIASLQSLARICSVAGPFTTSSSMRNRIFVHCRSDKVSCDLAHGASKTKLRLSGSNRSVLNAVLIVNPLFASMVKGFCQPNLPTMPRSIHSVVNTLNIPRIKADQLRGHFGNASPDAQGIGGDERGAG